MTDGDAWRRAKLRRLERELEHLRRHRRARRKPEVPKRDDASALLCVLRGIALADLGHLDAVLETFKEALRARSRDVLIRHVAQQPCSDLPDQG